MLSIPQPSSDASSTIDISETADQMKPFLGVLNLSHSPANPLDELDDTVWPIIARLAEKYDSATTREIVMGKCWCVRPTRLAWVTRADVGPSRRKWKCGIDDADNATQLFAAFETAAILGQPCLAKVFLFAYLQQSSRAEIVEALKPWGARFVRPSSSVVPRSLALRVRAAADSSYAGPLGSAAQGARASGCPVGAACHRVRKMQQGWLLRRVGRRARLVPPHARCHALVGLAQNRSAFPTLCRGREPQDSSVRRVPERFFLVRPEVRGEVPQRGARLPSLSSRDEVRPLPAPLLPRARADLVSSSARSSTFPSLDLSRPLALLLLSRSRRSVLQRLAFQFLLLELTRGSMPRGRGERASFRRRVEA